MNIHKPPYIIEVRKLKGTTNGLTLYTLIIVNDASNPLLVQVSEIHVNQAQTAWVIR